MSARFRQDDRPEAPPEVVHAVDPTPQQQAEHAPYNWREQWYPVHYAADLPEGQPQRVWLFDEAVVVARRPGTFIHTRSYFLQLAPYRAFPFQLTTVGAHLNVFMDSNTEFKAWPRSAVLLWACPKGGLHGQLAGQGPVAMLDRCPHRAAALSEGRMTAAGNLQCAYHGAVGGHCALFNCMSSANLPHDFALTGVREKRKGS